MLKSIMKISVRTFCALYVFAVLLNGCTATPSTSGRASASHDQPDPIEVPPHVGMTKDQVIAQYGRPRGINLTERGEAWHYVLNAGEIAAKSLIPFYIPPRPRFGTVIFGRDGRVVEYHWQPDPSA